ncbi:helix-turn-helix domain-containing protein [Deinococcus maricopensis]|uniref:Helix-turn-helix domain-containing protein AraC type n=1 Tax=Deinococcus maricopensis (strain DSM 21211 / LMG 22137 / NRRL B-23946 / LB-34) TaxID=709986 RepID=E8U3B5_DEIML|nr:helix-turn-helix domain-containing protein [Deinococcus maricopensis]ADV65786.1 helix-turn-helix domain-containing protein AraC type [Deinococcus maricopensis DSM 21211]
MARRLTLPSPALRSLVQVYWLMDEDHPQAEQHVFLPEQLAHLTFYAGRSWTIGVSGALTLMPQATLEGLVTTPAHFYSEGPVRAIRAELYPWAARQLFGWTYPDAALDLLAGDAGDRAARAAHAIRAALTAHDDETALGLLDDWLLALASGRQAAGRAGREWTVGTGVRAAVQLYHSGGQRRMADLAEELDVSPRTLERQFVQEVGIGAKTLARLIRFETAHNLITIDPQTPLATLAYDLGFSDQAHLTREFRALGGLTPGTFARLSEQRHQGDWLDALQYDPRTLLPELPD